MIRLEYWDPARDAADGLDACEHVEANASRVGGRLKTPRGVFKDPHRGPGAPGGRGPAPS